ncbi:MAG: hypothetical protein ACRC92_24050 [Peptostreptococcaceae bacterium]
MNRFRIKKDIYFDNSDRVLTFIKNLGATVEGIHLVINELTPEELHDVMGHALFINKIKVYNRAVVLDDNSYCDDMTYISGLEANITNQEFIDAFYINRMYGYRGTKLLLGTLYDLEFNGDMLVATINGKEVANDSVGVYDSFNMYEDRFISVGGLCKKCRNPMCDMMDEAKIIPFMVNHKSCVKNKNILEKVSKEVHEVRREEFVYLMEVLCDMRDASDVTANKVLEHLMNANKNEK